MANKSLCTIPDCGKVVFAVKLCRGHYWRLREHGDPLAGSTPKNTGIDFIKNVALTFKGSDCLRWPISFNPNGYGQLGLNGKRLIASRYVCEAAHGLPPSENHHAAHSCGNRWCVNPKHLRWATPKENNADKIAHNTHNKGERHGNAKLTAEKVKIIRSLDGKLSHTKIAKRFGVSQTTVSKIIRRGDWKHI